MNTVATKFLSFLRIATIVATVLSSCFPISTVYAAGLSFSDWGDEIANTGIYESAENTQVAAGLITAQDLSASFSIVYLVDLSSISEAVNAGEASLTYRFSCAIADEGEGQNDIGELQVTFVGPGTTQIHPCSVADQGNKSNSLVIPVNTTAIQYSFAGTVAGATNTVAFNDFSIVIDDMNAPGITTNVTPSLEGGAAVSVEVAEHASGIDSVYYGAGDLQAADFPSAGTEIVMEENAGSFTVASGGIYTIYASDVRGNENVKTVTVNTYPGIENLYDQSVDEDTLLNFSFLVNDQETAAGSLDVTVVSGDQALIKNDSISVVNTEGAVAVSLTPEGNANGSTTLTFSVKDAGELVRQQAITLNVNAVNDIPQVNSDVAEVWEDSSVSVDVLANDSNPDHGTLTLSIITPPANGSAVINGDNTITYTPTSDFYGTDSFTYQVVDSVGGDTGSADVAITVSAVDDAPVAVDDEVSLDEDSSAVFDVRINDYDVEGDGFTILSFTEPASGTLSLDAGTGAFTYAPAGNYHGIDSFTYTIQQVTNSELVSTASVNITVRSVNDAPVPSYDAAVSTDEDTPLNRSVTATDDDLDVLSFYVKGGNGPSHGTLNLVGGDYTYTPDANFNSSDGFVITVFDGTVEVNCPISVTVNPVNDSPQAVYESNVSTDEDTSLTLPFIVSDADGDSVIVSVKEENEPKHGSLILSDGEYTYTPVGNYHGDDSFIITISDGSSEIDCPISVTVNSINDIPVPVYNSSIITNEDTPVSESVSATDADLDTITVSVKEGGDPLHGTLNLIDGDYTYSPDANYYGTDTFTLMVSDGLADVDCPVTVTVNAVNDAPTAVFESSVSTDEDTVFNGSFTASDDDGDSLSIYIKEGNSPSYGTLNLIPGGYTYTPNLNTNGTDNFVITVYDEIVEVDFPISIAVNPINDAPVLSYSSSISTDEDTSTNQTFSASDIDHDELIISVKTENKPAHGSVVLSDGGYSYSPDADYNGSDAFTITVSDGTVEVNAPITVTINPINDAPVPVYDASFTTAEDTPAVESFTATDVDPDTLTFSVKDENKPAHGTIELGDGIYTYTPALDYNGHDTFIITVSDGTAEVDSTINVTVSAVNDAPVPNYLSSISTNEDTAVNESFTATDVDLDEIIYSIKDENKPIHGTAVLYEGGYTYTPAADYNGTDSFSITISDGTVEADYTITVTINPVNDAPVPVFDGNISTDEDASVSKSLTATDIDLDALSYTVLAGNAPGHGTLELIDGGYIYTPVENFNGADGFTITVYDGTVQVDCPISVTVNAVNDTPVAVDDSASTQEDTAVTIQVLANDSDVDIVDGDVINPSAIISGPSHGSTEIDGITIIYRPALNYFGSDEFTYQIKDTGDATATAVVSLTVNAVNDYPQADGLLSEYSCNEDSSITIPFNLTDVETPPETLTMQVVSGEPAIVAQNRIVINGLEDTDPAVSIKITPLANRNGDVPFTLRASDGFQTAVIPFTLHVIPVNDAPIARSDTINFTEDTPLSITTSQLLSNDTDIDNDQADLVFDTLLSTTSHGTLVDHGDGTLTYTPGQDYCGTDSFTYRIQDPDEAKSTTSVTLKGICVNDSPTINTIDDQDIDEDGYISVPFTVNDPDLLTEDELNTLMITSSSSNPELIDTNNMRITGSGNDRTFTAAPLADKNGTVTITITVSDGINEVSEDFDVDITPIPDNPVAEDDFFYVRDYGATSIDPLENDWDADEDTNLTPTIVTNPAHGSLTADGDTYQYTPDETFSGSDAFTYFITDSTGLTSTNATVTISADPTNHPPVISSVTAQTILEDEPGNVTFTVTDADGNLDSVSVNSSNTDIIPQSGLELSNVDSTYTLIFTPAENQNGKTILTISAIDSRGNASSKAFSVQVVPVNDLPTAVDDSVTTDEDHSITFNVLENDYDVETANADLILSKVLSHPTHGSLASIGGGQFRYSPYDDFNGSDSFSYEILDKDGGSSSAIVSITINSVNDAPEAYNNNLTTVVTPGGTLDSINVLGNDTDPDFPYDPDEEISVNRIVNQPSCGTVVINADETLKYEAFNGSTPCSPAWMTLSYEIIDHYGATDTAWVYIPVDNEDDNLPPHVLSLWRSMQEDGATITFDLSGYAFDPEGDPLTYSLILADAPNTNIGTATLSGSVVSYTPNPNKNASYSQENFKFSVYDGYNPVVEATIYIRVNAVNDAPTISMDSASIVSIPDKTIDEDNTLSLEFYIDDVDKDDVGTTFGLDDLGFSVYSEDFSVIPPESISYTRDNGTGLISLTIVPPDDRSGDVDITTVVSDGIVKTYDVFHLTINPVNDPPTAADYSVTTDEEVAAAIQVVDCLCDVDEGETFTITQEVAPAHGSLSFDNDKGEIIYTPADGYFGTDEFTYRLTDSGGLYDTGIVSVMVNNVNDAPMISDLAPVVETGEDTPIIVTFTVTDEDNTLDEIDVSAVAADPSLIKSTSFSKSTDGSGQVSMTITPETNLSGTTTFEITASDGDKSAQGTFTLKIYAINDPPVAANDYATIDEDHSVTINVIANDMDVEDSTTLYVISNSAPLLTGSGTAGHGSVVNNSDGTLTYTPGDNQNEDVYFTYQVSDSGNLRTTATVFITINAVNDAPRLGNDSRTTTEDTPITINVLANDSDLEGDVFSIIDNTDPLHGSVLLNADQTFTYSPELNYYGSDSFSYTVEEDEHPGVTATATVTITITASDDYPIVDTTEPWIMQEDTQGSFSVDISDAETPSANLLISFTSMNTDLIKSYDVILQGSGTSRTVTLTPQPQMNGSLQLQVEVNDGALITTELIDIIIEPVNDPPVAQNYEATTNEDVAVSGLDVVKSDIDLLHEGDSHTYSLGSNGAHGNAVVLADGNWTYTPDANFNGADSFTVIVSDAAGATAASTINITVNKVNDTPTVTSLNQHLIDEDTSVTDTIVVADPDLYDSVDPDSHTMSVTAAPLHGTVDLNASSGEYTYTPAQNYNGSDSFTVKVVDEHSAEVEKTVEITVKPVNDPPVAEDDSSSVLEDHSVNIDVLGNDDDIDLTREGDDLTIKSVDGVDNAVVEIAADGKSLTFTPVADWFGEESFTYTVKDIHGATDTATVTVTVNPVNDPPHISNVEDQTIQEDASTGALTFSVTDLDNDDASLIVTAATSNGTVIPLSSIVFDGSGTNRTVTINPVGNKNTWDRISSTDQPVTITLTVSDGKLTDSDSLLVSVTPVNDGPIARNDTVTVVEDNSITISVLANDSDADISNEGDNLTITNVEGFTHSDVQITGGGKTLSFAPELNWTDPVEFTYTISDSSGATDTATVHVDITAVNDAPTISDIPDQVIDEDTSTGAISFTIDDVDTSLSSLDFTATSSDESIVPNANIVIAGSGTARTVTVTPLGDKNTWNRITDSDDPITISIEVSDGALSNTDTFLLTVKPVNDAPRANNDSISIDEDDSATTVSVLANDTDVDISNEGDTITIRSVSGELHGAVHIATDKKTFTYEPDDNWNGTENLSYTIVDTRSGESTADVTITVRAVNDNPVAQNDTASTQEDQSVPILVLANDSDIDTLQEGDSLQIKETSGVDHGTVTIASDKQSLTFNPEADWSGTEVFTYTIIDEKNGTASASVTVTVSAVDDDPEAVDDTFTVLEDSSTSVLNVLANDKDVDLPYGDALELVRIVSPTSHGTLTLNPTMQRMEYKPDLNYNGSDSFTYEIKDDQDPAVYSTAAVTINITPVNDIPVITSINQHTIDEDHSVTNSITIVDPDIYDTPDPDSHTFGIDAGPNYGSVNLNENTGEYTYTPDAHYNGSDSFTVRVTDEHGGSATRLVRITINPINDPPVAANASYNTPENIAINETISASDPDIATNGDKLTYTLKAGSGPEHGTISLNSSSGAFTYTPELNYNGTDGFSVIVTDKQGESAQADISIYINYYENDPVANDDTYTMDEDDISVVLNVLANDADADIPYGDELTIANITGLPAHGTAVIDSINNVILYTPDPDYNGTDSLIYQIKDSQDPAVYASAQVELQIDPVNDPPLITSTNSHEINEDTPVTDRIIVSDVDLFDSPNPDSHTFRVSTPPVHGEVLMNESTGEYTYTPNADFNGTDSFIVLVTDKHAATDVKVVMITIKAVNDDPQANPDSYRITENDSWRSMDVMANDTDADMPYGDVLTLYQISIAPLHGTARINSTTNKIEYAPDAGYVGRDTFTYEVKDNQTPLVTSSAEVSVLIEKEEKNSAGHSPSQNDQNNGKSTPENQLDVLEEDSFANGWIGSKGKSGNPRFSIDPNNNPGHGTLEIDPVTGFYTYTPDKDFNGIDSFTIIIQDGEETYYETYYMTVKPVNDAPTGNNMGLSTPKGKPIESPISVDDIDVLTNDDVLTYTVVQNPAHGTVLLIPVTGSFIYTPADGFVGEDTFLIRITDEDGAFVEIEVCIAVNEDEAQRIDDHGKLNTGTILLAGGAAFAFLILFVVYNVRITYSVVDEKGNTKRKVIKKWILFSGKNEVKLKIKKKAFLKEASGKEVLLLNTFVKKFKGKTLILQIQGEPDRTYIVEANDNGRMRIVL